MKHVLCVPQVLIYANQSQECFACKFRATCLTKKNPWSGNGCLQRQQTGKGLQAMLRNKRGLRRSPQAHECSTAYVWTCWNMRGVFPSRSSYQTYWRILGANLCTSWRCLNVQSKSMSCAENCHELIDTHVNDCTDNFSRSIFHAGLRQCVDCIQRGEIQHQCETW